MDLCGCPWQIQHHTTPLRLSTGHDLDEQIQDLLDRYRKLLQYDNGNYDEEEAIED